MKNLINGFKDFLGSDDNFYLELIPGINEPNLPEIKKAADFFKYSIRRICIF